MYDINKKNQIVVSKHTTNESLRHRENANQKGFIITTNKKTNKPIKFRIKYRGQEIEI